jgi:non-ribosomal peptide synthetase component E (peptide arylation enzyme)
LTTSELTPLRQHLSELAAADPRRPAVVLGERTIYRGELELGAERPARTSTQLGAGHGDYFSSVLRDPAVMVGTLESSVTWARPQVAGADVFRGLLSSNEPVPVMNGPFVSMIGTLVTGGHLVLAENFDPLTTLELVERQHVSWLYLVPTMMSRIWRFPPRNATAEDRRRRLGHPRRHRQTR